MTAQETLLDETEDRIDYNALDNTTGGRALQAGFLAAIVAVPDYVASRAGRWATTASLIVANLVAVAAFNAFDEDPRNDFSAVLDRDEAEESIEVASVAKTWATVGLLLVLLVGSVVLGFRFQNMVTNALRKRGCTRPNTALGLTLATLYFAGEEAKARL
ncbi:hypothetical protein QP027_00225 [Corynebacterium breve]|uniref:Uncharacterized protein n=1 Tax=Corynebacterium breve TaxID=3049799 RepID=A0ABY8VDY1_9CORY|nr:hypothetical protein [Corynebacterium breve]WIM67869.1 hypothetical protein QP027_00225 [Corynebacterium breve]